MTPDVEDVQLVDVFLMERTEGAFRRLYGRHTPFLLALSRRLLGDPCSSEDVVQGAWIRAVRLLPDFRWASSLRTWLAGIVVNCCREERRRRRTTAEMGAVSEPATPSDRAERLDLASRSTDPWHGSSSTASPARST